MYYVIYIVTKLIKFLKKFKKLNGRPRRLMLLPAPLQREEMEEKLKFLTSSVESSDSIAITSASSEQSD